MTVAILQEVQNSIAASPGSTVTVSITYSSGNHSADVYVTADNGTSPPDPVVTDGVNTYTARGSITDASDGQKTWHFTADNINPTGVTLVTATFFPATPAATGIWVKEIGGTSGYDSGAGVAGQVQATPTTAANAVTSGNTGTLTAAASLVSGLSFRTSGAGAGPAVGTAFTSGGLGWSNIVSNCTRSENKRVTGSTAQAATFTAGGNDAHSTMAAIFKETTSSTLKTFVGVASASIKTISGQAIATVKTILGLTP